MDAPPYAAARGCETVLLVDPDPAARTLAAFMLGKQGYTVIEARSGAEAIVVLRESGDSIDLVLTEIHMPRIGGAEVGRRSRELRPAARVLFMSDPAYARFLSSRRLPETSGFLAKPFTMSSLTEQVRRALDAPRSAATA